MENFKKRALAWAKENPNARTITTRSDWWWPASSRHFGDSDGSDWQIQGFSPNDRKPLSEVIKEWEATKKNNSK